MKKRILAVALTLAMLLAMLPSMSLTAAAEETSIGSTVWDGTADTSWYDMTKTEFTITTAAQLAGLAQITTPDKNSYDEWTAGTSKASKAEGIDVDSFLGKTVKLGADIDLNGYDSTGAEAQRWYPIAETNNWGEGGQGTSNGTFDNTYWRGTFDGCGHTISNIRVNGAIECSQNYGGYQGFISAIGENGIVKNLGISSGTIYGRVCGGIVAYAPIEAPASVSTWPKIMNCWTNVNISGNGSSSRPSGGIFGGQGARNDWVCLINCYVRGTTSNLTSQGGVGGFVNGVVAGCYNTGKVANSAGSSGYGGSIVATLESIIQGQSTKVIVRELADNTKLQEGLFVNNFALSGTHENLYRFGGADSGPYNAVTTGFSTANELKAAASTLGSGYASDSTDASINDGYPVLFWQAGQSELSIAGATIDPIPDQKYTASEVQPFPVVKLGDQTLTYGTDYLVQWEDNIEPGTAKLTVIGVGRYTGTLEPVSYKILDIDWTGVTVDKPADSWVYGEPVTPPLTVKDSEGNVLTLGRDYSIIWKDNDKAGTAAATITNLGGTKTGPSTTFELYEASSSLSGSGTETDPYLISNRYDLQFLANKVNTAEGNYRTAYYKLTQDISLDPKDGEPENDPVGIYASLVDSTTGDAIEYYAPFAGSFDGDGHSITVNWIDRAKTAAIGDLECKKLYTLGLFGCVGTAENDIKNLTTDWNTTVTIKNLTINGKISECSDAGIQYAAPAAARAQCCKFIMSDVTNNADLSFTSTETGSGNPQLGGIVGYGASDDTFTNVINNGSVNSSKKSAGGIYAYFIGSGDTASESAGAHFKALTKVINNGDVTSGASTAGGIAGTNSIQSDCSISMLECANTGNITASANVAGFLPAAATSGNTGTWEITACCNSGELKTTKTGNYSIYAAGLFAYGPYGSLTIKDCYNSGDITNAATGSSSTTAGLVAYDKGTTNVKGDRTITGCYNSGKLNATKNVGAFIGITKAGALAGKATEKNPYVNTTISGMYIDTCANAIGNSETVGGTVTDNTISKTEAELKAAAEELGENYKSDLADDAAINGGYPILYWQANEPAKSASIICRNYGSDYNIVMYAADNMPAEGNAYYVNGINEPMNYVADYTRIFTGTDYDKIFSGKNVFVLLVPSSSTDITPEKEGDITISEAAGTYADWTDDDYIVCSKTGIGHNYGTWTQSGITYTRVCADCEKSISFDADLTKTEAASIANVKAEGKNLTFEISGLGSDEMIIAAADGEDGQASSADEITVGTDGKYSIILKQGTSIVSRKIGDADGNGAINAEDAGVMLLASTGAITLTGANSAAANAISLGTNDIALNAISSVSSLNYTERALKLLDYMTGKCTVLR